MNKAHLACGIAVLAVLCAVVFQSLSPPVLLSPKDGEHITDNDPVFQWKGRARHILVDDDRDFSSPIVEEVSHSPHELRHLLEFKRYYWKLKGRTSSPAWNFTIEPMVAVTIREQGNESLLTNNGNTAILVEVEEREAAGWGITGAVSLEEAGSFTWPRKKLALFTAKEQ